MSPRDIAAELTNQEICSNQLRESKTFRKNKAAIPQGNGQVSIDGQSINAEIISTNAGVRSDQVSFTTQCNGILEADVKPRVALPPTRVIASIGGKLKVFYSIQNTVAGTIEYYVGGHVSTPILIYSHTDYTATVGADPYTGFFSNTGGGRNDHTGLIIWRIPAASAASGKVEYEAYYYTPQTSLLLQTTYDFPPGFGSTQISDQTHWVRGLLQSPLRNGMAWVGHGLVTYNHAINQNLIGNLRYGASFNAITNFSLGIDGIDETKLTGYNTTGGQFYFEATLSLGVTGNSGIVASIATEPWDYSGTVQIPYLYNGTLSTDSCTVSGNGPAGTGAATWWWSATAFAQSSTRTLIPGVVAKAATGDKATGYDGWATDVLGRNGNTALYSNRVVGPPFNTFNISTNISNTAYFWQDGIEYEITVAGDGINQSRDNLVGRKVYRVSQTFDPASTTYNLAQSSYTLNDMAMTAQQSTVGPESTLNKKPLPADHISNAMFTIYATMHSP